MGKKYHYYKVGQVLGELTLIEFLGKRKWKANCGCGKTVEISSNHLHRKKSCGCLSIKARFQQKIKDPVGFIVNHIQYRYKNSAKRRNLEWSLNEESFKKMLFGDCHYCGVEPCAEKVRGDVKIMINGVDRVDNLIGYKENNTVPCCKICNLAKRNLDLSEFSEWLDRIVKFRDRK